MNDLKPSVPIFEPVDQDSIFILTQNCWDKCQDSWQCRHVDTENLDCRDKYQQVIIFKAKYWACWFFLECINLHAKL